MNIHCIFIQNAVRGDFMVTEQEITQVLDRALGHFQNGYVMKNIVDYQKYGHQTPLDGAKVSVGIGGFTGPGTPMGRWDGSGIKVVSVDRQSEVVVPHSRLVERAFEVAGMGQVKLF